MEAVAREVMQRVHPKSRFEDPTPGRTQRQAEWDWTMDGRKVECKSSQLSWVKGAGVWQVQFRAVKLALQGTRQQALFDDLLLVLLSPSCIDLLQHDMHIGIARNGVRTALHGHNITVRASGHNNCQMAARLEVLDKMCNRSGNCAVIAQLALSDPAVSFCLQKYGDDTKYFDALFNDPLSVLSPPSRGARVQQIALEIDKLLNPTAFFCMPHGESTAAGTLRGWNQASVDWIRDSCKIEVKHTRMSFHPSTNRWRCLFGKVKCSLEGVRDENIYDELWLVIYSPIGLDIIRHCGQFGLSTVGKRTAVEGHELCVYGPAHEKDHVTALEVMLSKLLQHGGSLLATVKWEEM